MVHIIPRYNANIYLSQPGNKSLVLRSDIKMTLLQHDDLKVSTTFFETMIAWYW